jgi:hypothetical protein
MICERIDTSSAETGSLSTISFGLAIMALAIAMRWRCPPKTHVGSVGHVRVANQQPAVPHLPALIESNMTANRNWCANDTKSGNETASTIASNPGGFA